ncbi:hypothetical protein [Helicobacter didelphidarum]|uniref:hypothetical protein n=1 Tax=Helicobacter didelphidarum TaxID=2040648 RepID=UPI001FE30FC8|nr:hypothetical protein [Helicobacter didelphidarum]
MKYYATIYIDKLFGEMTRNFKISSPISSLDFTHAFLGLTKGKSPDELDAMDKELRDRKLKNKDWRDIDKKWYESLGTNEYNDGFWGFGTANRDLGIIDKAVGKVFENNQYIVSPNKDKNIYDNAKLRSSNTFNPSNRCILEISQEQYETLLQNIHKDYQITIDIKPQTKQYKNSDYRYDITRNNCVHWVQKHLSLIGVEIFEQFDIPGSFMDIFDSIREVHSIFLQFQAIDSYLESVKGAKTFRRWVDNMVGNKYLMCSLNKEANKIRKENLKCEVNNQEAVYMYWTHRKEKIKIYQRLKENLDILISKSNKQLKGVFHLLYVSNNKGYILSPPNYETQAIDTLDLTIPANNFSVSEFYPFIFIPDDEMIARILYHEYDYGTLSPNYTKDTMEFYYAFLEGREIQEYWSEAFHTINKRVKDEYKLA